MKAWWNRLSLDNKLQIPIQSTLLITLLLTQLWVTNEFKKELFGHAEHRAINSAAQAFWGLNSMMLNGNIGVPEARRVYFKKMAGLDGVADFHLVRGKPVQQQFGIGLPEEQPRDEMDRKALSSAEVQIKYLNANLSGPEREIKDAQLRVVVPFQAGHDFHGTNCLQCHHVPVGAVNGAVSLTVSLADEYAELVKIRTLFSTGHLLLQILLFLLVRSFIRKAIMPVITLEKTMLAIKEDGDFNKQVQVESKDEVGHIAEVFNNFLRYIGELRQQLANKVVVLEKYHDRSEDEQRVGGFIMSRMTQMPAALDAQVLRYMKPVEHLSGDILIAAKSPDGTVYILLADAIGHGLSAAINVLPLCQTFYDLVEKGFSIGQIAADLNQVVNKFMPVDRFVSAAVVSIHETERIVEVWNGGMPSLLLFNRAGQVSQRWTSDSLPLGILSGADFSVKVESYQYHEDCQLCMFSDGLIEANSPQDNAFEEAQLIQLIGKAEYEKRYQTLLDGLEKHLGGQAAHDDISFALVDIRYDARVGNIVNPSHLPRQAFAGSNWCVGMCLGAAELKYLDVVPLLTQIIAKLDATCEHHSALFMILSELFNNALDHGLLQLNSVLKLQVDGFEKYLDLRDERLRALQEGKIEIEISLCTIEGKQAVKIRVMDTGSGFDYAEFEHVAMEEKGSTPFGRGIALVKSIACKLQYSEQGNEVIAYYICSPNVATTDTEEESE